MKIDQPIVFYDNKSDVNHENIFCKYECIYDLHSPNNSLLPFIVKRPSSPKQITGFRVECYGDDQTVQQLDVNLLSIACTVIENDEKFDLIVYDGSDLGLNLDCGHWQIVVTAETEVFYSEIISVGDFTKDDAPYWKLAWSSECGKINVPFDGLPNGFEFYMFLNGDVEWGVPQYEQEITDVADGLGKRVIESQRFTKVYTLESGFVPEFIVDAMSFSILNDKLELQYKNSTDRVELLETEFAQEPDENGCYHEVSLQFKLEEDRCSGSCCTELEKTSCISQSSVINIISSALPIAQGAIEVIPPNEGDCYYISIFTIGCPLGSWCDNLGRIACWNGSGWDFTELNEFDVIYDQSLGVFLMKEGTGLAAVLSEIPLITFTSLPSFPFTTLDVEATISPCYFGRLEWSYDNGSTWSEVAGTFTYQELKNGVTVAPRNGNPTQIRLVMFNYNCPEIIGNSVNV